MLLLIMFITSLQAAPYKIGVVSEPAAIERAQEFIQKISHLEPFKQLIHKKVIQLTTKPMIARNLSCRGGNSGIARLAKCNLGQAKKLCRGMQLCPVFTAVPNIGAGNSFVPVASSSFPWTTMLHEVVHTFDFTDEYAYTPSETKFYCGSKDWVNGVTLSNDNEFSSEKSAIEFCQRHIPWCKEAIQLGATVIQKNLQGKFMIGSPPPKQGCPDVELGVFLGGSCQNKNPVSSWRPYFCPTVMGYPTLGEGSCHVEKRHAIILKSPNLLPPRYQQMIFEKIIQKTKTKNVSFEPSGPEDVVKSFTYGIPEIDRLKNDSQNLTDDCH